MCLHKPLRDKHIKIRASQEEIEEFHKVTKAMRFDKMSDHIRTMCQIDSVHREKPKLSSELAKASSINLMMKKTCVSLMKACTLDEIFNLFEYKEKLLNMSFVELAAEYHRVFKMYIDMEVK